MLIELKNLVKIITILTLSCNYIVAQRFADQVPQIRRYYQKDICDTVDGIKMYNKLLDAIGGDSVTYNKAGYNLQGWNEDYYMSGKLLHRGYYIDGKVIVFKNFFENGQCERTVVNPDPLRCNMEIFYENGKPRKQIYYYNGLPQKKYEYFNNGLPKYLEENEKEMQYVTLRKNWYSNGQPQITLELTDEKAKKYKMSDYYPNGQLKSEGNLIYSSDKKGFLREGTWNYYDQTGKSKKSTKANSEDIITF